MACRLCRSIGDANHRKNLFNKLNEELLRIVEQLCGHPLLRDPSLAHLLCRPCERRLKHIKEFREVVRKTQIEFRQQQPCETRVKRCLEVSPLASQPPRSRLHTSGPSARTSLNFAVQDPSSINKEVLKLFVLVYLHKNASQIYILRLINN